MRKIFCLFNILLILIFVCSSDASRKIFNDTVAVVFGEKISRASIEYELEISKISYQHAIEYINNSGNFSDDEKNKEMIKLSTPKTFEEILHDKIRIYVLYHEAVKNNITVSYDDAFDEAKKVYNNLFHSTELDRENKEIAEYVNLYMKENNLSEKEYIDKLAFTYYRNAMINKLKALYKEQYFDKSNSKSFDEQFSEYANNLIENARIQIFL